MLTEKLRRELALGPNIIDLSTRLAVPISEDAAESLIYHYEAVQPRFDPDALGWDLLRLYGENGRDLYAIAVAAFGNTSLTSARYADSTHESYLDTQWASFARERVASDRLLIDLMDAANHDGWTPPPEIAAQLATLENVADENRVARTAAEEAKWQAAADAEAEEWIEFQPWPIIKEFSMPTPQLSIVPPESLPDLIKTSAEFIAGFVPPDYLVDGILQRRFFYAITAQTGIGKTAVAMLLTALVSAGRPLGGIAVEKGAVLYLAGENPTDIQMRWLGVTAHLGLSPDAPDVHFIEGAMDLAHCIDRITAEVARKNLKPALVVVDTAAAYNFGDDENSNAQAGNYARLLRRLTLLPGGPCVIVLTHPTKHAAEPADLLPRGGSAFLAELDGNIALARRETLLVAVPGKLRGAGGWSLRFELEVVHDHPKLKDAKGRRIKTVVARSVDESAEDRVRGKARQNEDAVLRALDREPGLSPTNVAKALGWVYGDKREPNRNLADRTLRRLADDKLAKEKRGGWYLTPDGQRALNDMERAAPPAPLAALPSIPERPISNL